jgi:hypothetical protein
MINPSASGWIDKYFARLTTRFNGHTAPHDFYKTVRDSGFIYGYVATLDFLEAKETKGWTAEEATKATLLNSLYGIYCITDNTDPKAFTEKAIAFYDHMTPEGHSFLKKVLPASPKSHQLEDILDERIKTNDNIISRNFSHILTNALLFMDVLAFGQYLVKGRLPDNYLKKLEETIVGLALLALNIKSKKTSYDDLLIKLFEASVRYTKVAKVSANDLSSLEISYFEPETEKLYLLDIAGMAIWSDGVAENAEIDFLYRLAAQLGLNEQAAPESIAGFDVFIKLHRNQIPYFKYSNPVKHFYDHASQNVMLLINRNRKRLIKELSNNGELMLLLTHSAHRSLDAGEKKKIKKQLLEICKTIPSLTIFLLPGGSLLLPLLIKFIPQLLPSVFNENLDEEA